VGTNCTPCHTLRVHRLETDDTQLASLASVGWPMCAPSVVDVFEKWLHSKCLVKLPARACPILIGTANTPLVIFKALITILPIGKNLTDLSSTTSVPKHHSKTRDFHHHQPLKRPEEFWLPQLLEGSQQFIP
jgi:hypothetical protein